MSRKTNNLKRMMEAKLRQKKRRLSDKGDSLLDVVRSIPGRKILTITFWDGSAAVIVAHPDGSLGQHLADDTLFRTKFGRAINNGGMLVIRAFDDAHPEPVMAPAGRVVVAQRQMLYGAALGGGKWQPLSADELQDAYTTCRCCGEKLPTPGVDYFDLLPFAAGIPERKGPGLDSGIEASCVPVPASASPSSGLQWRRSSMAWIASVPGHDDLRGHPLDAPVPPEIQSLCGHLLGIGGKMVCVDFREDRALCEALVEHGLTIPSGHVEIRRGERNRCHANSELVWSADKAKHRIATGFALAEDQMWRRHSWVVTTDGTIIETTTHPWTAYFGIVFDEEACRMFLEPHETPMG
jgi:hypothetical protein